MLKINERLGDACPKCARRAQLLRRRSQMTPASVYSWRFAIASSTDTRPPPFGSSGKVACTAHSPEAEPQTGHGNRHRS